MSYADDIAEMIADLPVDYIIGVTTYTGAVNEISKGQDAGEGGFLDDFDLTIDAITLADAAEVRFNLMSADR